MLTLVKKIVPRRIKRAIKRQREAWARRRLFGELAPMVPAEEEMFDGTASLAEFKANGEEFLAIYRDVCGLKPDERMLDVGSGIGRKTLPLTRYLNGNAAYDGIDINEAGVRWCTQHITPCYPNFRFQRIDVYNGLYNPTGTCPPSEYRFPFPSSSFSFVMLGSVFTHMMPADVERYLSEVHRVLMPGGRCLISYFLLNDESRRLIASGASALDFRTVEDSYATVSSEVPEKAVAFAQEFIERAYGALELEIVRIDPGSWCGRAQFLSYQDLILARKKPAS